MTEVHTLDAMAQTYAARRTRREALDAAITADIDVTPEAVAVRNLHDQLHAADELLLKVSMGHPRRAELVALSGEEEAAKKVLLEAWPAVVKAAGKTIPVPGGKVQLRVTEGVEVTDSKLLAEDLLKKGLFAAAVKDIKVDAKFLRPIIDTAGVAGAQAKDAHTLAWLPTKEA